MQLATEDVVPGIEQLPDRRVDVRAITLVLLAAIVEEERTR
jgi:hypothetical protein